MHDGIAMDELPRRRALGRSCIAIHSGSQRSTAPASSTPSGKQGWIVRGSRSRKVSLAHSRRSSISQR